MHFSLGAGCSAAAGPVGRVLEADIRAGDRGSGMCYTYSCSKGAFVGVSLGGNVVATRMDTNLRFYGDPYLTTSDILLGMVDRPKAAQPFNSLPSHFPLLTSSKFCIGSSITGNHHLEHSQTTTPSPAHNNSINVFKQSWRSISLILKSVCCEEAVLKINILI
ncbi:hypothetical protein RIF29_21600 [Crotalaria pallida]|uniref:Ysc84 actin-binding domain-containing protein n=1 Tax=Crotalaria pallida TaxID=3830 RepID=A0AAN9F6Y7_CROPI